MASVCFKLFLSLFLTAITAFVVMALAGIAGFRALSQVMLAAGQTLVPLAYGCLAMSLTVSLSATCAAAARRYFSRTARLARVLRYLGVKRTRLEERQRRRRQALELETRRRLKQAFDTNTNKHLQQLANSTLRALPRSGDRLTFAEQRALRLAVARCVRTGDAEKLLSIHSTVTDARAGSRPMACASPGHDRAGPRSHDCAA